MCYLRMFYLFIRGLGNKVWRGSGCVHLNVCVCVCGMCVYLRMSVCVCWIPLIQGTKTLVISKMLEDFHYDEKYLPDNHA